MITKEKNKGNIPIKSELLNKYATSKDIFNSSSEILNNHKTKIFISANYSTLEKNKINSLSLKNLKELAYSIFCTSHINSTFYNGNNKILVSKSGINESIEKIYNNRNQRDLLLEHLIIFSRLGEIIETAVLVSQTYEKNNENTYALGITI